MWNKIVTLLEMIKFKHSVFAMPFAFMGMLLAARGMVDGAVLFWVVIALVSSRTCAMGFNRIVDRHFDALNPRTAARALPTGKVTMGEAWMLVLVSGTVFFGASFQLNHLAFLLSPLALALSLLYSYTKRFTWLCHIVLGVALSCAPIGGYVAVLGTLNGAPWFLSTGVLFWVAGFDTVYGCLDAEFDRRNRLHSLPARFGRTRGVYLAHGFHVLAFLFFAAAGVAYNLNRFYFVGLLVSFLLLLYQHYSFAGRKPDPVQIRDKFMPLNGVVSILVFCSAWLGIG